jgi:hypothetical protein
MLALVIFIILNYFQYLLTTLYRELLNISLNTKIPYRLHYPLLDIFQSDFNRNNFILALKDKTKFKIGMNANKEKCDLSPKKIPYILILRL